MKNVNSTTVSLTDAKNIKTLLTTLISAKYEMLSSLFETLMNRETNLSSMAILIQCNELYLTGDIVSFLTDMTFLQVKNDNVLGSIENNQRPVYAW